MKTPERCHAVFIFNFEHIQQNNQFFLLLTLTCICPMGRGWNPQNDLRGH